MLILRFLYILKAFSATGHLTHFYIEQDFNHSCTVIFELIAIKYFPLYMDVGALGGKPPRAKFQI